MENLSGVQFSDDQYFLLYFIMATYFGPDIKGCKPQESALRRHAEVRPPYHINDLAGSCIKTMVIESVYYYILRKAEQSVIVKQPLLLQYIRGTLPSPVEGSANYPKFDDIFPSHLHKHSHFDNQCDTIDNIVFINNPEIGHVKPQDIERFKRLSGLEDFVLDRDSAMLHVFQDDGVLYSVKVQETSMLKDTTKHANVQHVNCIPCTDTYLDGNDSLHSTMPFSCSPCDISPVSYSLQSQMTTRTEQDLDHGMIFLPSCPSREEWSNLVATVKCGFALTGSAARGHVGPVLGLIDIGESEDSYLFRVSLPGVRRDESKLMFAVLCMSSLADFPFFFSFSVIGFIL